MPSPNALLTQIEFYFSDVNLPRDKFILSEIAENNGWFNLSTLLNFNRIKMLVKNIEEIADVIESSDLLELDESRSKLKRKFEVRDVQADVHCGVYVSGFPSDIEPLAILDEVKSTFASVTGIQLIKILKDEAKQFNGQVLIDFESKSSAKQCLDLKDLSYKDHALKIVPKLDYIRASRPFRSRTIYYNAPPLTLKIDIQKYFEQIGSIQFIKFIPGSGSGSLMFNSHGANDTIKNLPSDFSLLMDLRVGDEREENEEWMEWKNSGKRKRVASDGNREERGDKERNNRSGRDQNQNRSGGRGRGNRGRGQVRR